jgi:circadian clock protein KaiC
MTMENANVATRVGLPARISTGVAGLDAVLNGGLVPNRVYLIEGVPGAGKTTLGLHFLLDGVRRGESGLYITLSETAAELRMVAASHNWSLDGLSIHELVSEDGLAEGAGQSCIHQKWSWVKPSKRSGAR